MSERWTGKTAAARRMQPPRPDEASSAALFPSAPTHKNLTVCPMPAVIGLSLAWTPFLYGGNDVTAWGVNGVLFGALLCVGEGLAIRSERAISLGALRGPALLFSFAVVWAALQVAPNAPEALQNPAWDAASRALGLKLQGYITVAPLATELGLVRLLTAACAFWVCLQAAADARGARILILFLGMATAAYALYGLVASSVAPGAPAANTSARDVVTSSFVNRNHYATYAGLGVLLWMGLLVSAAQRGGISRGPLRYRLSRAVEACFGPMLPLIAALVLCAAALLLTGSRAGLAATGFGTLILFVALRRDAYGIGAMATPIAGVLILGALGLWWQFGDVVAVRITEHGLGDAGRLAAYQSALDAILARPILGHGYGVFEDVFPQFRKSAVGVWGVWDHAHNTYIDLLIGLGVLAGISLIACVVWLGLVCWRGARRRKSGPYPAVALGSLALVGAHAMLDFSLEIQGVTLTFMAILAMGVAQSMAGQMPRRLGRSSRVTASE